MRSAKSVLSLLCFWLAACSSQNTSSIAKFETAIIGGEAALESDLVTRSTVSLIADIGGMPVSVCTGVLISRNLILTAAHCLVDFERMPVTVYFGATLPVTMQDPGFVGVAEATFHNQYHRVKDGWGRYVTSLNDIGLIKLAEEVPAAAEPVAILDQGPELQQGTQFLLAGFGLTNELGKAQSATGLNKTRVPFVRREGSVLVADHSAGQGACRGDSGGPAFLETSQGLMLAAVTRGAHAGSPNCRNFGEYTSVSYHKQAILELALQMGAEAPQFKTVPSAD